MRLRLPVLATLAALALAGCQSSAAPRQAASGTSSSAGAAATTSADRGRVASRKGTCDVEVAALVDYDIDAAKKGIKGGSSSLAPTIGASNPVLLAAEAVTASVFHKGTTSGATKAIAAQCTQRHYPVLDAHALDTVKKAVPQADVAVLEHVTITR